MRYLGKSSKVNLNDYKGSGIRWNNHCKKNGYESVITEWISEWFNTSEEINNKALFLSEKYDIVNSNDWANLKEENGLDGGDYGYRGASKFRKTVLSKEWKETVGKKKKEKYLRTINDPEWKETVGNPGHRKQSRKIKETINNPEWKETVGKAKEKKRMKTINDPEWKETVGKQTNKKDLRQ
tara:strand:- start:946 stop:1491 length:546 start_codon:yes stop_codon:yes gene_type:complete